MEKTISAKLIAVREAKYTIYVFKNLDNNEYVMCVRLPNWQTPDIIIGDSGFLQIQYVKAGEEYFNIDSQENQKYKYTNVYYKNFVKESITLENSEIIL